MTPKSPDEALHFRGKTLTPESPRPLHVAEPTSIPVLQNQMDPVFNDTSTYEQAEHIRENNYNTQSSDPYKKTGGARWETNSVQRGQEQRPSQHQSHTQGSLQSGPLLINYMLMDMDTTSLSATTATAPLPPSPKPVPFTEFSTVPSSIGEAPSNFSLTTTAPDPSSLLAHPAPGALPSSSQAARNIPFANEVDNSNANLHGQTAPQGRLDAEERFEVNTAGNGVDFQNLLDNLPSSSAPSAPAVSGNTVSADSASASPQAAADEAPQSSLGLPPRPPPQEKPSIHPNYNPGDDIRSYHQLPAHNTSNTSSNPYAAQPSNYQPNVGLSSLTAGAPGTSSGAGSLPPPPVASFQQSPTAPADSQDAPATANQKNGRVDKQPPLRTNDDAPWGPEVQKKYDSFLHDERIYVTEGLWDRFPYGSRLFVGQ